MIKEVRLALLGVSVALGSSTMANAQVLAANTDQTDEQAAQFCEFTRDDIRKIRECVAKRDVLCLRAILVANPDLMQCDTALSKTLLNFMSVTDATSARDLMSEIGPVFAQASAIY